jgi:GNAT superfamily N-acetyltransferase
VKNGKWKVKSEALARVRRAGREDAEDVLRLIQALADFEKLQGPDQAARERLRTGLFDGRLGMVTLVAEVDGVITGYAVAYEKYSTFSGLPNLFLEDIFVAEEHRGSGAGFALFREVAREADRRGCGEMEWQVLAWNRRAMDFYERLGARRDEEWHTYLLGREGIRAVLKR